MSAQMTTDVKLDSISLILESADMLRPQSGCGQVNFLVPTQTQKIILWGKGEERKVSSENFQPLHPECN